MMRLNPKVFRPSCLVTCEDLGHGKILQVLVVSNDINWGTGTFRIMSPLGESFKYREELFVVNMVVAFWLMKHAGMESNWVQLARRCHNGKYGSECVVRGISLNCDWCIRHPVG